jgi:hypothetical protein
VSATCSDGVADGVADGKAPQMVKAAVRLESDLKALETLLERDRPPKRRIRNGKVVEVYYGFGDASARDGSMYQFPMCAQEGTGF